MQGNLRFSLSWLMSRALLASLAVSLVPAAFIGLVEPVSPTEPSLYLRLATLTGGITCCGAFFGGLFGRIGTGILSIWALFILWMVLFGAQIS